MGKRTPPARLQGIVACVVFEEGYHLRDSGHEQFTNWLEDRLLEYFGEEALQGFGTAVVTGRDVLDMLELYASGADDD